jgi:hypothetical protein
MAPTRTQPFDTAPPPLPVCEEAPCSEVPDFESVPNCFTRPSISPKSFRFTHRTLLDAQSLCRVIYTALWENLHFGICPKAHLWYCVDIPVMESGPPDRAKAGSSLRHWPPGTNSKTFVPSFFALSTPSLPQMNTAQSISPRRSALSAYRFLHESV